MAGEGGADPESLAEFEQLLEDTAGDVRGPKGMEVAEGLELEGASGQLGKHGVSRDFSVDDFPNVSPGPEPAKKRLKSQPVSGDTQSSPMYTPSSPQFLSSGPPPTPGCPSCPTDMNAPGCRHSAKCQRAHQAWFEARKVSLAGNDEYSPSIAPHDLHEDEDDGMPSVPGDSHGLHADAGDVVVESETRDDLEEFAEIDRLDAKSLKREADVSVERLEESMRRDGHSKKSAVSGIVSGMIMIEDSLAWESIALLPWPATDDTPCLKLPLFSIRFSPNATSVVIPFGKEKLRLWVPESAIDDTSLKELPGEATPKGMQLEMSNLSDMGCGDVYSAWHISYEMQS